VATWSCQLSSRRPTNQVGCELAGELSIRVDATLCQGHNRCAALYPELFDLDEQGKAVVRIATVPSDWEDRARGAISNCPERAISEK
jgi:ferredoxin